MIRLLSARCAVLISLLVCSGCAGLQPQEQAAAPVPSIPAGTIAPETLAAMPERETLHYEVRWLGLKVGSLTLSVLGQEQYRGRLSYVLEARMQANAFLSAFYHIADRYTSYMDAVSGVTLCHEAVRREGAYRKDARIEFDHAAGKAYFSNRTDGTSRVIEVPAGVHDMMTSFYHVLRVPLEVGERIEYPVCHNEKNYLTTYTVKVLQTMKFPRLYERPVEVLVIEPVAYEAGGRRVEKGTVKAYYTGEPFRRLLLAVIRGPVFTALTVTLTRIDAS
jgi:hypothetical protein